jgi:molecular chaperone DnaK
MTEYVYGIDLGANYSAVARIGRHGDPELISNPEGGATTPSTPCLTKPGAGMVGTEAKQIAVSDPDNSYVPIKRHLGSAFLQNFQGETFTPEGSSALILRELVRRANGVSGCEISKVVIAVPAYFGVKEREATRQAGQIAGLDVIGIVAEPVAVALSAGARDITGKETVLVYDLGGGRFDVTILKINYGNVEVVAVDGSPRLGGADWDAALVQLCVEKFISKFGLGEGDPRDDEEFMLGLRLDAEETKKALSQRASCSVQSSYGGQVATIDITRVEFEQATRHLVSQTVTIFERLLEIARHKESGIHVDRVLLSGGSSRMPMVRAALRERFGENLQDMDFDLAVAKGAAIYAQAAVNEVLMPGDEDVLLSMGSGLTLGEASTVSSTPLMITNVLVRGLGIELPTIGDKPGSYIHFFAHANDQLPRVTEPFRAVTVRAHQENFSLKLYEQRGQHASVSVADNTLLSVVTLPLPPALPVGAPIDVTIEISSEGLVSIMVTDVTSWSSIELSSIASSLSEREVAAEAAKVAAALVRSEPSPLMLA